MAQDNDTLVTARFGATVTTGLESIAKDEIKQKLQIEAIIHKGRIVFETSRPIGDILKLKTINNLFVIIHDEVFTDEQMPTESKYLEPLLMEAGERCDWRVGLLKWKEASGFERCDIDKMLMKNTDLKEIQPKFRVSSNRYGLKHTFTSPEICSTFGHVIDTKFGWPIRMKDYDLEVYANFSDNYLCVCISLTPGCLASGHIKEFGLTTLRAVYCYAMLKLAKVETGDIVLDPMAGSGAISVETCYAWLDDEFHAFAMAGELQEIPLGKCSANLNIDLQGRRPPSDKMRLDVTKMPIRDNCVDVIISDLPFGRRHGSKRGNKTLYPALLRSMGRVTRLSTGRAVLLTQDKHAIQLASAANRDLWTERSFSHVKVGNLHCYFYMFQRNDTKFSHDKERRAAAEEN